MKNNKTLKIIIVSILLLIILAILVIMQFTKNKDVKDATEDKNKLEGTYIRYPERNELTSDINESLVVEFYNK